MTCHDVLCVSLHIQPHIQVQLQSDSRPARRESLAFKNPWKHSFDCVYLNVHMGKWVSKADKSNMWTQLQSRLMSCPLLRCLKFKSQEEHNMDFGLFYWGVIKLDPIKQKTALSCL